MKRKNIKLKSTSLNIIVYITMEMIVISSVLLLLKLITFNNSVKIYMYSTQVIYKKKWLIDIQAIFHLFENCFVVVVDVVISTQVIYKKLFIDIQAIFYLLTIALFYCCCCCHLDSSVGLWKFKLCIDLHVVHHGQNTFPMLTFSVSDSSTDQTDSSLQFVSQLIGRLCVHGYTGKYICNVCH